MSPQSLSLSIFQIRYFNPKARDFYFHGVTPVSSLSDPTRNPNFLVGEPEFYVYPAPQAGQNLAPQDIPSFHDYINAYPHHHAVSPVVLEIVTFFIYHQNGTA